MTAFLARRVYEGHLEFADVPARFKEEVRAILKEQYGIDV